jgi:hypothetical protein
MEEKILDSLKIELIGNDNDGVNTIKTVSHTGEIRFIDTSESCRSVIISIDFIELDDNGDLIEISNIEDSEDI